MKKKKSVSKKPLKSSPKKKEHPSKLRVHFSSKKTDHEAPNWLYEYANKKFKFKADLAASKRNAKHEKFFTEENSALDKQWPKGWSWCNPPYGHVLGAWCKKAYEQSLDGRHTCMLVPSRTDTARWFHKYVVPFAEAVVFISGRLTFKGSSAPAPFPSMLVLWGERKSGEGLKVLTLTQPRKPRVIVKQKETDGRKGKRHVQRAVPVQRKGRGSKRAAKAA
jgi:phage N-6-adenine-methyltransferase